VKKIIIALLCSISLCCAQLMPANMLVSVDTTQLVDSAQTQDVQTSENYDLPIPAYDVQKDTVDYGRGNTGARPLSDNHFPYSRILIATGAVVGLFVLALIFNSSAVPPIQFGH